MYIYGQCFNVDIQANRVYQVNSYQNAPDGTNGIFVEGTDKLNVVNNFVQTQGSYNFV